MLKTMLSKFLGFFEKRLPVLSVGGFIFGISFAHFSFDFEVSVTSVISGVIEYYSYFAPIAIYLILAPALAKILFNSQSDGKGFVAYAVGWLSLRKLAACLWGAVFTALVLGLPMVSSHDNINIVNSIFKVFGSLGWMFLHSTYFYAVYLALISVVLSYRFKTLANFLEKIANVVEAAGPFIVPFIPLFMLAIGAYIYGLPHNLKANLVGGTIGHSLGSLNIIGFGGINANTPVGMISIYLAGAALTGIACLIWHGGLLFLAKMYDKHFSIKNYFINYWSKVYPLLWATSSESIATPLNLHLVHKYFPEVRDEVRRLIVGMGSFLNINGTLICVFVILGVVCNVIGYQLSLLELILCIPVVFIISFGVPGIPGELLLFAGPLSLLLGIPGSMLNAFLALYLGLQIGLPDSFRSGNNSTDNCVLSIMLNKVYEKKFIKK